MWKFLTLIYTFSWISHCERLLRIKCVCVCVWMFTEWWLMIFNFIFPFLLSEHTLQRKYTEREPICAPYIIHFRMFYSTNFNLSILKHIFHIFPFSIRRNFLKLLFWFNFFLKIRRSFSVLFKHHSTIITLKLSWN